MGSAVVKLRNEVGTEVWETAPRFGPADSWPTPVRSHCLVTGRLRERRTAYVAPDPRKGLEQAAGLQVDDRLKTERSQPRSNISSSVAAAAIATEPPSLIGLIQHNPA